MSEIPTPDQSTSENPDQAKNMGELNPSGNPVNQELGGRELDQTVKENQLFANIDKKNFELGNRLAISVGNGEKKAMILPTPVTSSRELPAYPGKQPEIGSFENYLIITQQGPKLLEVSGYESMDWKPSKESVTEIIQELQFQGTKLDDNELGYDANIPYEDLYTPGKITQHEGIRLPKGVMFTDVGIHDPRNGGIHGRLMKDGDPDLAGKILQANITRAETELRENKTDKGSNTAATDKLNDMLGGK